MKKLFCFCKVALISLCGILFALSFLDCGKTAAFCADGGIGLLTPGVLKVGVEIGYPPFEFFDDDGTTPIGLDIDLGKAITKKLGVALTHEDTAWDAIFAGLGIDKYDCVISAATINADRAKIVDFTTPYIENWMSIVVKKGGKEIKSVKELEGLSVGFQGATTADEYLAKQIETGVVSCKVNSYDKVLQCFDDLRLGRIDAVICDSTVSEGYTAKEPDNFAITWHQSTEKGEEAEVFGIAVKKGNAKLLDALNKALQELKDSGELDKIIKNWL
ncbi:basic amino acid ABC transporter substrate-binding protein [Synergistales bacterium]|nr:basic amino acid ABC transporter substrate-binding protein [Synergistales bacterium]